ncbi:stage II sporulation protein P [Priestia filamentosa]|uniref:stage II sporulation protein P n=1 Tax=Priestia filamentosa TaxID=1402861 RepID=UPI002E244376|nr:stage II sporulation protein P [Priestia filamentosa]MED3727096.1 stage II sporulation protein P [Priestia filamentosa]
MRERTEQEWIRLLKESKELDPDPEYVRKTREKILSEARKSPSSVRKRSWKTIWPTMMAICLVAVLTITVLNHQAPTPQTSLPTSSHPEPVSKSIQVNKDTEVFIYNTHSWESFETKKINGYNQEKNVQTVAKSLGRYLTQESVPTTIDDTDYTKLLMEKDMDFQDSYELSRKSVQKAVQAHPKVQLVLDIHRDDAVGERETTTTKIDGKDAAKVQFFVSNTHPSYEGNLKVATHLDRILNEMYPGISRGILKEGDSPYHNPVSYNQDLHPGALLINIGGVENTLKEEERTTKILATAIKRALQEQQN